MLIDRSISMKRWHGSGSQTRSSSTCMVRTPRKVAKWPRSRGAKPSDDDGQGSNTVARIRMNRKRMNKKNKNRKKNKNKNKKKRFGRRVDAALTKLKDDRE